MDVIKVEQREMKPGKIPKQTQSITSEATHTGRKSPGRGTASQPDWIHKKYQVTFPKIQYY